MARFYPAWSSYRCTGGTVIAAEITTEKGSLRFALKVYDSDSRESALRDIELIQASMRRAREVDQ